MAWAQKRHRWRDREVAQTYERRRFHGLLGRVKTAHDARCVCSLLRRAGSVRSVLDLPVGTGRLRQALQGAGYGTVGADLSREMLLAGSCTAELLQAEGEHLPFRDDAFDAVICVRLLFHVDALEPRLLLLREMARVARRGVVGHVRLAATFKHRTRRIRGYSDLLHAFESEELRQELDAAGMELRAIRPASWMFSDKAFFLATPR
jgi:ubiquinone/menaquinone biosynthesis C-methylase UbiE